MITAHKRAFGWRGARLTDSRTFWITLWLLAVVSPLGASCMPGRPAGSTVYYAGFSGYDLPLKMTDPLPKAEAEKLKSYYVAAYDDAGRLVEVRKFVDGRPSFLHEYQYGTNGTLVEARVSTADGLTSIWQRGPSGDMTKVR